MKDNRYKLNSADEIPLLGQEEIRDIYFSKRIRLRKPKRSIRLLKKICLGFFVVSFVFLLIIIHMRYEKSRDDIFVDNTTEGVYENTDSEENTNLELPVIKPSDTNLTEDTDKLDKNDSFSLQELYEFDYSLVPDGEKAIIPIDLSIYTSGAAYINNQTGLICNLDKLLKADLRGYDYELITATDSPKVLIVHTHATEAYSKEGAISYSDESAEIARALDCDENVVSLGNIMAEALNEYGVRTLHCEVMHDSIQNKDSYLRSANTIKNYLKKYPSIELVIDLHRDSIISSNGEMLRPVILIDSEPVAQVMCIVGSDWLGEECERWQDNLSLALKLREYLNGKYTNLCRPPELRGTSYNQELSRYSLHIEIGASGNNLKEAKRSCELVAQAIAEILFGIKK